VSIAKLARWELSTPNYN